MPSIPIHGWIIGGCFLALLGCGSRAANLASTQPAISKGTGTSAMPTVSDATSQVKAIATTVTALTPTQKTQIVAIITQNTNHYLQIWKDGQSALGDTQYPNAMAGVDAFNDPNSAASRFSHYRLTEGPEHDSSYDKAFVQADAFYTGSISDDTLSKWSTDMLYMVGDMNVWIDDAIKWQIRDVSTWQLTQDAQTVTADFTIAQQYIQAISK